MEIYNKTDTPALKEFEELLNSQFTKNKDLVEGKVITCTVSRVTDNYIYLQKPGLKQEPILDSRQFALMKRDVPSVGDSVDVLLERLEHPKTGEIVVSAEKALKLDGWNRMVECHKNEEHITGRIISKVKGGAVVSEENTGMLCFLPGSMIHDSPLKSFDHLFSVPLKFAIVKLDVIRGNVVVSRRHVLASGKKVEKAAIMKNYEIGQKVMGVCKQLTSFGAFFTIGEGENSLDCLCHTMEIDYDRISHPEEKLKIGDTKELLIIDKSEEKNQISLSLKRLQKNPFDIIKEGKYEVGKDYKVQITKVLDFGIFASLEKNLNVLIHATEISHVKKNINPRKIFSIGQEINIRLINIEIEKQQIAGSIKATEESPYEILKRDFPVGTVTDAVIENNNEYAFFVKITNVKEILGFLHFNQMDWGEVKAEDVLGKWKKGMSIKVQIMEINTEEAKVRVSHRNAISEDPFIKTFQSLKPNDVLTVQVVSSDPKKGLIVKPLDSNLQFPIKKSAIAVNAADSRPQRWIQNDKLDVAIQTLDLKARKVTLSIKLLEEILNAEALKKYKDLGSGKSLPFASLEKDILKKNKKEE